MRVNIHLPDELHHRLKEQVEINVSATCRAALERELRVQAAAAQGPGDLAETVARLVRSRADKETERHDQGYQMGLDWAREVASWDELATVAALADQVVVRMSLDDGHSLVGFLVSRASDLGLDPDPDWFDALGDGPFERGLIQGAADVYRSVKDLVLEAGT